MELNPMAKPAEDSEFRRAQQQPKVRSTRQTPERRWQWQAI
jgi:hypothetical protein